MAATDESSPRELLRRLSLHRLLAFQDAVDAGSFAAASHHEPTRASLFSRQVTELERLLGVQLLDRRGGRCAPTAAGLRLRGVVAALAAGLAEVGEQGAAAKVALTLAAGDSVLQWLVLPRVAGVLAEQPRVQLSLVASSDPLEDVVSGKADFGLARARAAPAGVTHRVLGRLTYALFVPPRLARAELPLAERFASLPLVRVTGDAAAFDRLAARARSPITPALSCETFPQAARAVATGSYAAVLPAFAAVELGAGVAKAFALRASGEPERLALFTANRTVAGAADAPRPACFAALARALAEALGERA